MLKVFKYALEIDGEDPAATKETELEIPKGSQILSVELTAAGPALFVLVDEDAEVESRSFVIVANGVDLPEGVDGMHYRGTAKVPGAFTWHVFELTTVKV